MRMKPVKQIEPLIRLSLWAQFSKTLKTKSIKHFFKPITCLKSLLFFIYTES